MSGQYIPKQNKPYSNELQSDLQRTKKNTLNFTTVARH